MQTRIAHRFSPDLSMENETNLRKRMLRCRRNVSRLEQPFAVVCRSRCFVFQRKPYMTKRNHFAHWSITNQFYSTLRHIVCRSLEHRGWVTDPYAEESIRRTSLGSECEGGQLSLENVSRDIHVYAPRQCCQHTFPFSPLPSPLPSTRHWPRPPRWKISLCLRSINQNGFHWSVECLFFVQQSTQRVSAGLDVRRSDDHCHNHWEDSSRM